MARLAKRTLSASEVEFIRETLKAAGAEFDELMRSKEWYVTSVAEDIEQAVDILEATDGEESSGNTGHPDRAGSTD